MVKSDSLSLGQNAFQRNRHFDETRISDRNCEEKERRYERKGEERLSVPGGASK